MSQLSEKRRARPRGEKSQANDSVRNVAKIPRRELRSSIKSVVDRFDLPRGREA